jgi:hypothetical protein
MKPVEQKLTAAERAVRDARNQLHACRSPEE